MDNFLNLTLASGEPVYINMDQIAYIHKKHDGITTIVHFNSELCEVKETVQEVLKRIEIFVNSF